jgi:hypothetical protein
VTFVTPGRGNNARIQVESRCRLTAPGEEPEEFLLVASCKGEDTYGEGDLFLKPSYDFCCIFSSEDYVIVRTFATTERGGREIGVSAQRFAEVHREVATAEADLCEGNAAIVAAALANRPLMATTELHDPESGCRAVIEYPIKTMNVNDLQTIFQVDTGPVLFPDLSRPAAKRIECFELAFVVYRTFDRAEFLLLEPTPVPIEGPPALTVPHYAGVRQLPARNAIYALTG